MEKLICCLLALAQYSKDIHYKARGVSFYSDHLLADRIHDNCDGWIDDIKEVAFLGRGQDAPYSKTLFEATIPLIPELFNDVLADFTALFGLLEHALLVIENLTKEEGLTAGERSLVEGIAEKLQQDKALVGRRIK